MRTFAQKPKATRGQTHSEDSREVNTRLHLQRTAENQAAQPTLRADAERINGAAPATESPRAGHDFRRISIHAPAAPVLPPGAAHIPITALPIQGNSAVSFPDHPLEREADALAADVMRMTAPASFDSFSPASPRWHAGGGEPLRREVRSYFEPRFGYDFSDVRIHTDSAAANSARAVQARAYTTGRDVVFASGKYEPATTEGKRLLAHELAHVVQQRQRPSRGILMRQPAPVQQQAPVRPATVQESAEFLEEMVRFIESARSFALDVMRATPRATAAASAATRRAHGVLNQKRLRDMLANARRAFAFQESALQSGSPDGTRLRAAMLAVVAKIREVAPVALGISDSMPAPTPDDERGKNAQLMVELIEADPFTSAGLVGTPSFGAAETAAGTSHEAFIEAYLDDLVRTLPGQTLAAADRDRILERISAGLRRAFITVGPGPAGTVDVRGITNQSIVDKYRRVVELLSAGLSARPAQLSIITDLLPAYNLPPDPVPDVTPQLTASANIGAVDFSRVPTIELPYVRHGVLQAANTNFGPGSTVQRRNASWPVALHVRRGGNVVDVRYDLIFDANSNVRVERLGDATPREVAPAFAQLSIAGKKAQLIADFGLAGVDDRPAAGTRPAAAWAGPELDQIKAAYDLIPAADRPALAGVTLVRDSLGPPAAIAGQVLAGFAHTSADPAHDLPGPAPHGPPHIHYYDFAFSANAVTAVGPPGSTGPGADSTIAHEVGHMRIFLATRQANAAVAAANAAIVAANAGIAVLNAPLPQTQHQVRQAYGTARAAATAAIQALNAAVIATPPATAAQRAVLLQAAQTAVAARDQARATLAATAGVPAAMVQAANNLDAAMDALLAATQSQGVAQDQIPTFIALARAFTFTPFTDYGRRGGDDEFFAETYALFLTDPNRLSAMNRNIFLWFQAGMPMDPNWRP